MYHLRLHVHSKLKAEQVVVHFLFEVRPCLLNLWYTTLFNKFARKGWQLDALNMFRPEPTCYLEFKLRYLKNQKLDVKELSEPTVSWRKGKTCVLKLFLYSIFSKKSNFGQSDTRWFYGKKCFHWKGKSNSITAEIDKVANEMCCDFRLQWIKCVTLVRNQIFIFKLG